MRGELAVELREQRHAVGEPKLRTGGGERGIFRQRRAVDDEACARERLEHRQERRVAHPVVCPGDAPAQRQHRVGIDRQHPVEARTQLAARVGRVARAEAEPKAVGDDIGLGEAWRVEALRLDRGVGRDAATSRCGPAGSARLPSDLHVIMHPQIVETDRQLTRRYVASVPRCWAMWIGLTESRSAGGTDQAAGC